MWTLRTNREPTGTEMPMFIQLLLFALEIPAVIVLLLAGVYALGYRLSRPAKKPRKPD
jgi:hypothetical protein